MKKLIPWGVINNLPLKTYFLLILIAAFVISCLPDENEIGRDILPAGDNIYVFYDSLDGMKTYPALSLPFRTSETYSNPQLSRVFLLGNVKDTISGFSRADIVTQFNPTSTFKFGPNMVVDSLVLSVYFLNSELYNIVSANIRIHELTERIYMDSAYFTDYDMTGKYNPVPIAEKNIIPSDTTLVEFIIEDQDFINKFINPPNDTLFFSDSLFKDYFNGLYITSDAFSSGGFLSKVQLSKSETRLSIKYASDSTKIDTIEGLNFVWSNFLINEYTTQKMNLFHHDYTGTAFENIIDNPDSRSPILYSQGMNGINTKLHLDNLENWADSGIVAINSAFLEFEVVPDSISGLELDDLPERLILLTDMGDYTERLYDFVISAEKFDGNLRAVSEGVFYDTTYVYRFNIGLHYQYLINGDIENRDLVLQPYDSRTSNKIVKLWSNYSDNKGSLRLKIIYTKFE